MFDGLNRFSALADDPLLLKTFDIPAHVLSDLLPSGWPD
jgi:hypothetical protein